jgi:hypothetical protein
MAMPILDVQIESTYQYACCIVRVAITRRSDDGKTANENVAGLVRGLQTRSMAQRMLTATCNRMRSNKLSVSIPEIIFDRSATAITRGNWHGSEQVDLTLHVDVG